jgi:hypothetical protein
MEISQRVRHFCASTLPIPCLDRRRFFRGSGGGGGKGVYKELPITGAAFSSLVGINP